jgi:hypothetical protein
MRPYCAANIVIYAEFEKQFFDSAKILLISKVNHHLGQGRRVLHRAEDIHGKDNRCIYFSFLLLSQGQQYKPYTSKRLNANN